ncbi:coiled-coil domain-containing protein 124-like [Oppia nitens]|uniref:coiled-coil domain-containing protein 124-like n=1 Tax=Oppia nitens TaxID=1686743 RepID=UPI0023D987DA|nr:coiled-coil domain-containing protein 124-like [Oppia nitens]
MPKKLGINSKSVEAKARKDAIKQAKDEAVERQKEDEFWKDDDKHVTRKLNRKDEKEKKKQEVMDRKATNRAAYVEEMDQLKGKKIAEPKPQKVSRFDINEKLEKQNQEKQNDNKEPTVTELPIEENVNRLVADDDGNARSVEDAIALLSTKDDDVDRHPEKRMKAAYTAFEEIHLDRLKKENPNLRLSQLKQMLKKDWMKSPDNPLNQRAIAYNTKI